MELTQEQQAEHAEIGKIKGIESKWQHWLEVANALVASDELDKARQLVEVFLPGYYRDNPPKEFDQFKKDLSVFFMTQASYLNNKNDIALVNEDRGQAVNNTLRGQLILKDVQENPGCLVVDFGPGEYWLPMGLKQNECHFKYKGIGITPEAFSKAKDLLGDVILSGFPEHFHRTIFVATEIIEHLADPRELLFTAEKLPNKPDIVHLSTPKYTYGGGFWDWRTKPDEGGHLRTYTPSEFCTVVTNMFKGYSWQYYDSVIMHMRGVKNG